jgi:hypothetical protein
VTAEAFGDTLVVGSILANPRFLDIDPSPAGAAAGRSFRVAWPGDPGRPGERRVERIRDPWGREWAMVWGRLSR